MPTFARSTLVLALLFGGFTLGRARAQEEGAGAAEQVNIKRLLPPAGMELNEAQQRDLDKVRAKLKSLEDRAKQLEESHSRHLPDAIVFLKAVRFASIYNEFYRASDLETADELLSIAEQRLDQLAEGHQPWAEAKGLVVRGYRSNVDGSVQPFGLEIGEELDLAKPNRLLVWLHGRGDKTTDLHFIAQRLRRAGQAQLPGAIVLHPFGRQCVGYKSAGETDVLDVIKHVQSEYSIDADRIVLMGFSMGGAGAWHLGAHFADHWAALSPGAGFAETRRYNRIPDDQLPNEVERLLWGQYDVPGYVRNLFNIPVVAYSGELDKQIQAAEVMEEAYRKEGRELPHRIGPGMGHKYHPEVLAALLEEMNAAADRGRPASPRKVSLQTRTLRYSRMYWVQATGLKQHWKDARVDAERISETSLTAKTKNVRRVQFDPWKSDEERVIKVTLDGQTLMAQPNQGAIRLVRDKQQWRIDTEPIPDFEKQPGLQGPMDDAFVEPFLVVRPVPQSGKAPCKVDQWVDSELRHFEDRWRALMRGDLRIKDADKVTESDLKRYHLVLWGTRATNPWIDKVFASKKSPLVWDDEGVRAGDRQWDSCHVPQLIHPNPLNPRRYVVVNSGLTFREGHDRTNSLQNPKNGDWAVVDVRTPASGISAGKIAHHGLFDEQWKILP